MGLDGEQVNVLKRCFDGFADEEGAIPADNVGNILSMMGLKVKPSALKEIIEEIDEDGELNKTHFGKRKEGRLMSISLSCRFWIARIWRVLSTGSQIPD
jgi:Ca2+-binding EF-hand superfamily protein